MLEKQSEIVIDLAKEFIGTMQATNQKWKRAFFRFQLDSLKLGSIASYESENSTSLIDPFEQNSFYATMNNFGENLIRLLDKEQGVFLLTINSDFDYKIDYYFENMERWGISKMNGRTGIPEGT